MSTCDQYLIDIEHEFDVLKELLLVAGFVLVFFEEVALDFAEVLDQVAAALL